MTNAQILRVAMEQSALDATCSWQDFCGNENKVVLSVQNPGARKYLALPFYCNLISYGNNIVASVDADMAEAAAGYINRYAIEHCFETPNMHVLDGVLQERGHRICFMAEYFLPDVNRLQLLDCAYEIRLLYPKDFAPLYTPQWSNALCEARKELDVLAAAAFDGDTMVGMAGCSADCETMWQIGIDVLPDYRQKGVASALTSRLALEILARGKVPFYCAAWSNIRSVRNAMKSGFRPAWVEMTAKPLTTVANLNQ